MKIVLYDKTKRVLLESDKDREIITVIKEGILEQARASEFRKDLTVPECVELVLEDALVFCGCGIFADPMDGTPC